MEFITYEHVLSWCNLECMNKYYHDVMYLEHMGAYYHNLERLNTHYHDVIKNVWTRTIMREFRSYEHILSWWNSERMNTYYHNAI